MDEVNIPEVTEHASNRQFGAQTCKIHVFGHQTCTGVHIRSHFMYTDVSMAYVAFQCGQGPLSSTVACRSAEKPLAFFIFVLSP